MAPHSRTLAWKIPWTEEPGGLQSMGSLRVGHDERLHFDFSLSCIGEGNGNPLQCSCLENPRDGGAWWAAIYGVAQSQTRLKWLSNSCRSLRPFLYTSVYFCHLFLISSASVKSLPFLTFIVPIFAWNVPLVNPIFLKRSLVFPILLSSFISLHWSLKKAFLSFPSF